MYKILNNGLVVRESDNAYIPQDQNNTDYAQYLDWVAAGNQPTKAEDLPEDAIAKLELFLDSHLDAVAQEKRYANRIACAVRAGYPGPFQAEGVAFATWMDRCNSFAYEYLAQVKAGQKSLPSTPQELIDLLPPMRWSD